MPAPDAPPGVPPAQVPAVGRPAPLAVEAPLPSPSDPAMLGTRALLGAAAVVLVAVSVLLLASRTEPFTYVNAVALAARAAFAGALAVAALDPAAVGRALRAPRLATPRGLGAYALVCLALYFVFGLGTAVSTAELLQQVQQGQDPAQLVSDLDRGSLLTSLSLNFAVFTIPVLAWAATAQGEPGPRALTWTRLSGGNVKWSVAWALAAVLLVFWLLIAAGLANHVAGGGDPSNPRAEAIAKQLDIPTALLVAAMTGVGEELFFRGFLLRKVGNVPQAVLFGLAHANYLQFLELGVTALLGFGFGRTAQKTNSLWGPILGHAAFNATSLLIIIARSNGWLG